jgi:C-terminal processing protease CtpA/Prc
MDSLVQLLTSYYGGLPHWRQYRVVENMIIELYRAHIRAPFHIEYVSAGQRKQATYTGTTAAEINKAVRAQTKPKTVPFTFERLNDNIGYLNFWDMDYSYGPSFDSFLLKTFTEIKKKPVKALIVDIRDNGGGDSELGYKLLEHITNKAFRMSGGVIWKVSQEFKDHINSMDSSRRSGYDHYFAKANGDFFAGTDEPQKPKDNPLRYNGKVCFLISNRTFSSANMLASTIMDYKLATLIGEKSGERPNDFGDVLRLKLPHTGMLFATSSKQFVRPNGDKNDMNPVLPDIYVEQNAVTKEDEVLERAIQWVKKGR